MRQIKFRGRDIKTGEWVYGDLQTNHRTDGSLQFGIRSWEKLDDWIEVAPNRKVLVAEYYYHEVDPESVAQLVGHDVNSKEVYEGDILTDEKGFTYEAALQSSVEWQNEKDLGAPKAWRGMPFAFAKAFAKLTLKEAQS